MGLEERMRAELVRALVGRAIWCPVSQEVLDIRTCVVIADADGDPAVVLSQAGYATLVQDHPERIESLTDRGFKVDQATVKTPKP